MGGRNWPRRKDIRQNKNRTGSEKHKISLYALSESLPPWMAALQTSEPGQGLHQQPEGTFYCKSHSTNGETGTPRCELTQPSHRVTWSEREGRTRKRSLWRPCLVVFLSNPARSIIIELSPCLWRAITAAKHVTNTHRHTECVLITLQNG